MCRMNYKFDAMLTNLPTTRRLLCWLAAGFLTVVATSHANAQIVLFVSGEPITAYDIEQRIKLTGLGGAKPKSRQEVIDDLIDDRLKILAGKRFSFEVPAVDVDNSFAGIAR